MIFCRHPLEKEGRKWKFHNGGSHTTNTRFDQWLLADRFVETTSWSSTYLNVCKFLPIRPYLEYPDPAAVPSSTTGYGPDNF